MNMLAPSELPNSAAAVARRVDEMRALVAGRFADRLLQPLDRQREIGRAGEIAGHDLGRVGDEDRVVLARPRRAPSSRRTRRGRSRAPGRPCRPRRGSRGCPRATWRCAHGVNTAPPFCASPAMSIMPQPLPSRCAAMPSTAPIVTTPVPPTPSMIADQPSCRAGTAPARARRAADRWRRRCLRPCGSWRHARSRRTGRSR